MTGEEAGVMFAKVMGERSVEIDPGAGWWQFEHAGHSFQAGIREPNFEVMVCACELDSDPDVLDEIYDEIRKANEARGAKTSRYEEADCYLYLKSVLPMTAMSKESIETAIGELCDDTSKAITQHEAS